MRILRSRFRRKETAIEDVEKFGTEERWAEVLREPKVRRLG